MVFSAEAFSMIGLVLTSVKVVLDWQTEKLQ
jgi:hypothetical protein